MTADAAVRTEGNSQITLTGPSDLGKRVRKAVTDALSNPDLEIGHSVPVENLLICGGMSFDSCEFSPLQVDQFGRVWKENMGKELVYIFDLRAIPGWQLSQMTKQPA